MQDNLHLFDDLVIPLVVTDTKGHVLYGNEMAKEMLPLRAAKNLTAGMDMHSQRRFNEMTEQGALLQLNIPPYTYRCIAVPFGQMVGMFFVRTFAESRPNPKTDQFLMDLVPSLHAILVQKTKMPFSLLKGNDKDSSSKRALLLVSKMMDVYLSDRSMCSTERAVSIDYFLSVLSYFFQQLFKYQGVELSVSERMAECEYSFMDHRNLAAMFLSVIELMVDRVKPDFMYIDLGLENGRAVFTFTAHLCRNLSLPDENLPDAYILLSLLKRNGIEYKFGNCLSENGPAVVCKLYLPEHLAKVQISLRSREAYDKQLCIIDFMEYLQTSFTSFQ